MTKDPKNVKSVERPGDSYRTQDTVMLGGKGKGKTKKYKV
jgi:hypothetical protein